MDLLTSPLHSNLFFQTSIFIMLYFAEKRLEVKHQNNKFNSQEEFIKEKRTMIIFWAIYALMNIYILVKHLTF